MSVSLGELAVRFGCELRGDPDRRVEHVATLVNADERSLAFLANPHYRQQLAATRAAAVVLGGASAAECPTAMLLSENPYATYARIATVLHPLPAVVSFIGPHSSLAEGATLAADVRLTARVTLGPRVSVGARSVLQPGVVIGGDGFGFAPEHGAWLKVPQLGTVRIGDDVEIGANTTIDRGAIDDTVIEEGVKLDNLIMIGHNVRIGAHSALAACVAVAGSTTIGKRCMIGGLSGFAGHLTIADDVVITGYSAVTHSIARPGVYSGTLPVEEAHAWRRLVARFKRSGLLATRVRRLERAAGLKSDQEEDHD